MKCILELNSSLFWYLLRGVSSFDYQPLLVLNLPYQNEQKYLVSKRIALVLKLDCFSCRKLRSTSKCNSILYLEGEEKEVLLKKINN